MTIQANFPALRPSLLIDFANVKQLDSRITFTRASEARFYDGKTFAKAEENLLYPSAAFDDAAWGKDNCTITANTVAAPDGTTTADTFTEGVATALTRTSNGTASVTSGLSYVFSVFVRNGDRNFVQIAFPSAQFGANAFANFDISTGVLGTVGSAATASITAVGGGWYRCVVIAPATGSGAAAVNIISITSATDARAPSITGTGKIFYLWGAQLEQRSSVTAYTATTTQPITNYIPQLMTAASGVARFDHDPVTEESLGLLIEEQRTNLLTYSAQFDNAAWTKTNSSVTANTVVSPDGTLDADKVVESTANGAHDVRRTGISASASTAYTQSVYVKAAERTKGELQMFGNSGGSTVVYDLVAGTATASGAYGGWASASATITNVGNGWYRVTHTVTTNAGLTSFNATFGMQNAAGTGSYTGDGYSGIFIWGAQLEAGAGPATSYIPTVAAQVTRSADSASMTGTNFSSWYRQDEGTLYAEGSSNRPFSGSPGGQIFGVATGATNRIFVSQGTTTNSAYLQVEVGGTAQANLSAGSSGVNGSLLKMAASFQANNFALVVDASTAATDASGTIPVANQALIGGSVTGSAAGNWNGHIRKIAFYPARVTNAQLQALTS